MVGNGIIMPNKAHHSIGVLFIISDVYNIDVGYKIIIIIITMPSIL